MIEVKENLFAEVKEKALALCADYPRWQRATLRAAAEIETNPYLAYRDGELLVLSSSSLEIYCVNGASCQCRAYEHKKPCWHRSARRLFELYLAELHGQSL